MASALTFIPHQSSPLARTISPYKNPRTPPCTPAKTAKLWDEYERRAVENARVRETPCVSSSRQATQTQRLSNGTVLDIIKSYDQLPSPQTPGQAPTMSTAAVQHIDFRLSPSTRQKGYTRLSSSTTVAICKTCKQAITSTCGICQKCKKTIVISSPSGEATPPLSPACRNFGSLDLPKLEKSTSSGTTTPTSTSPKRSSQRRPSTQLMDPPIRLSSLKPHTTQAPAPQSIEPPRPRKLSLTDPHEPFLRPQVSRKPTPRSTQDPTSPTTPPSTSSSSSHSHSRVSNPGARPSSLANITTPPHPHAQYQYQYQYQRHQHPRHASATPSELSTLYPYMSNSSTTTTSPPSVCRASVSVQNATSAWDDWDSDEEKAGLVGYWRGRRWRGSRGSLGGAPGGASASGSARRDSGATKEESVREEGGRKRRGFVRVISCGCGEDE